MRSYKALVLEKDQLWHESEGVKVSGTLCIHRDLATQQLDPNGNHHGTVQKIVNGRRQSENVHTQPQPHKLPARKRNLPDREPTRHHNALVDRDQNYVPSAPPKKACREENESAELHLIWCDGPAPIKSDKKLVENPDRWAND